MKMTLGNHVELLTQDKNALRRRLAAALNDNRALRESEAVKRMEDAVERAEDVENELDIAKAEVLRLVQTVEAMRFLLEDYARELADAGRIANTPQARFMFVWQGIGKI